MEHEINYVTQTRCSILFFIVLPRGGDDVTRLPEVKDCCLKKKQTTLPTFLVFFFLYFLSRLFLL